MEVGACCGSGDGLTPSGEDVGAGLALVAVVGLAVATLATSVDVPSESADGATLPPQAASTPPRMAAGIVRPQAM